ncbi:hypothetical protein ABW20_dc0102009 [Dactylellina cionopaga]|nr:hypothetical protein ABW20_dc0102009 [Dactylellina cionopaga]
MATQISLLGGAEITILALTTVSLQGLESRNAEDIEKLLLAAQSCGIFYLDFHGSETGNLLVERLGEVLYLCQQYFDQDIQEKIKDVRAKQRPSQDRGQMKHLK